MKSTVELDSICFSLVLREPDAAAAVKRGTVMVYAQYGADKQDFDALDFQVKTYQATHAWTSLLKQIIDGTLVEPETYESSVEEQEDEGDDAGDDDDDNVNDEHDDD